MSGRVSVVLVHREPEHFEHAPLRRRLALEVLHAVRLGQVRVAGRIPLLVVDAVQDAHQLRRALAENAVEPEPVLRGLDLLGIARAHGRDHTAEDDAGLQKADAAPVLHAVHAHQRVAETEPRQPLALEHALVGEVVDGEHHRHPRQGRRRVPGHRQNHRHEPGLPVVRVNRVVPRAGERRPPQRRVRQEREALGVVGEVLALRPVDPVAVEIGGLIDEDGAHAVGGDGVDTGIERLRAEIERDPAHALPRRDAAVARDHHLHFVSEPRERPWQGTGHVGEAPGLGKRYRFRGHHQDPHPFELWPHGPRSPYGNSFGRVENRRGCV